MITSDVYAGCRYLHIPIPPGGVGFLSDPVLAIGYERPVWIYLPTGWIQGHVNVWGSPDAGATWIRYWSTAITQLHFVVSGDANEARMVFTQSISDTVGQRGHFTHYKLESYTNQVVERTVTMFMTDAWSPTPQGLSVGPARSLAGKGGGRA